MSVVPSKSNTGFKPKGRPRGRPKGWLKRPEEEQDLTTIKVTRHVREMLENEKREKYPRERLTDVLSHILRERTDRIKELEHENRRLKAIIEKWKEEYAIIPTE
jgi:hypothetical protein